MAATAWHYFVLELIAMLSLYDPDKASNSRKNKGNVKKSASHRGTRRELPTTAQQVLFMIENTSRSTGFPGLPA